MKVGTFSVSIPEAINPELRMLMELARSREQDVDVGNLASNRQINGQDKDFIRQVQEGATAVFGTGSIDNANPQEVHDETDRRTGAEGAEGCKDGPTIEKPFFCGDSVEKQILEAEGRIAQKTRYGKR